MRVVGVGHSCSSRREASRGIRRSSRQSLSIVRVPKMPYGLTTRIASTTTIGNDVARLAAEIAGGERLDPADDQAGDDGAEHAVEAAEDDRRENAERRRGEQRRQAGGAGDQHAGDGADQPDRTQVRRSE